MVFDITMLWQSFTCFKQTNEALNLFVRLETNEFRICVTTSVFSGFKMIHIGQDLIAKFVDVVQNKPFI